jgi:nucleoid-associated protein YgaU
MATAKLFNEKMPFEEVEFDFNPEALTYQKGSNTANGGSGQTPSLFFNAPPKELGCVGYLIGDDCEDRAEQLYAWLRPGGGIFEQLIGAAVSALTGGRINLAAHQPTLIFQWGSHLLRCILTGVTAKYERFSDSGTPIRALITLALKEEMNIFGMLPTNPTSGGLPGRQRHVVSHGENLQGLSTRTYGKPNLWRGVADANNIDDPFRVRPGDVVYLPNPNEIIGQR